MNIEPGKIYVFTKSYNKVRAIAPCEPYLGQPHWTVERIDGTSVGKQMSCPSSALELDETQSVS